MIRHVMRDAKPNELIIYASDYCRMYYDTDDKKIKVEGGNMDKSAQDLVSKLSFRIAELLKKVLKDPEKVSALLDNMSDDDLTSMLLQYKLMVEKKLFERS